MLRNKAEKDNAEERAEALKKRGTKKENPTISLGLNRNVDVFRRYWFGYHYANYLKDDKKDSNKNNEEKNLPQTRNFSYELDKRI